MSRPVLEVCGDGSTADPVEWATEEQVGADGLQEGRKTCKYQIEQSFPTVLQEVHPVEVPAGLKK